MSRDFPHLSDTVYPGIENVDVFRYQNTFDYTRWTAGTRIKLLNVPWCGDYDNAVKWEDDSARDSWFDSQSGETFHLTAMSRVINRESVKIPVPFDVAAQYNYLEVEYPIATSADSMIYGEHANSKRRWHWFIDDVEYGAPNTTILHLHPDYWTTFINDASISYMMLERGHAPMAAANVDSYLADPINNNDYLLAPDISYGDISRVRSSEFIQAGTGVKYVCISTTISAAWLERLAIPSELPSSSNPTYSSNTNPYGLSGSGDRTGSTYGYAKYYNISNYQWSQTYRDYSQCRVFAPDAGIVNDIANSVTTFAIRADEAFDGLLDRIRDDAPQMMQTVKAIFIASESMLNLGERILVAGIEARICEGSSKILKDIKLTKDMFGYPERYRDIAKLYTFPYCELEVTDGTKTAIVKVEDISSNAAVQQRCTLGFPILNWSAILTGIGGDSKTEYSWKQLDGRTLATHIENDDWRKLIFDYDIPTFSIYQSAYHDASVHNYNTDIVQGRLAAVNAYHAANRAENVAFWNNYDSANMAVTNVGIANAANTANTATSNSAATDTMEHNNTKLHQDATEDNLLSSLTTFVENTAASMTNENNVGSNLASGVLGAVGSLATGNVIGAVGGLASTLIGSATANANTSVSIGANSAVTGMQVGVNISKTNAAVITAQNVTNIQNTTQTAITSTSNAASATQASNSASVSKNNAWYSREDAHYADDNMLRQAFQAVNNRYKDITHANNVQVGMEQGSQLEDSWHTRGLQFNVRTQRNDAIAAAGDQFRRYGYACNRNWNFEDFNVMSKFTYWKAGELWLTGDTGIMEAAQQRIKDMISRGVTVWRTPDDIGRVSIYENEVI